MSNEEVGFLTKEQEKEILHKRAVELSGLKDEAVKDKIPMVRFLISGEWYGLDVRKIKEILETKKVSRVPGTPDYVLGIVNLRGEILSIIDLGKYFGLDGSSCTVDSRIIVVEANKVEAGLLVDFVSDIIQVEQEEIQPPLATLNRIKSEYIYGEVSFEDKLIAMLSLENILKL